MCGNLLAVHGQLLQAALCFDMSVTCKCLRERCIFDVQCLCLKYCQHFT